MHIYHCVGKNRSTSLGETIHSVWAEHEPPSCSNSSSPSSYEASQNERARCACLLLILAALLSDCWSLSISLLRALSSLRQSTRITGASAASPVGQRPKVCRQLTSARQHAGMGAEMLHAYTPRIASTQTTDSQDTATAGHAGAIMGAI